MMLMMIMFAAAAAAAAAAADADHVCCFKTIQLFDFPFLDLFFKWVCLKIGYIPNEIAIFNRDNDQQNHWVQWGTNHFQTKPNHLSYPLVN